MNILPILKQESLYSSQCRALTEAYLLFTLTEIQKKKKKYIINLFN